MPTRQIILEKLREELKPELFDDNSLNGLQVEGKGEIQRLAVAVDAGESVIEKSIDWGADALLVHHGLFWGSHERIAGPLKRKLSLLFSAQMSLFAMHLPLDAHARLGNNAALADLLSLGSLEAKANFGGRPIGFCGGNDEGHSLKQMEELLRSLPGASREQFALDFGPERPERVCVVSGGGVDQLRNHLDDGFDTLITGEAKQFAYHFCKEHKLNAIFAGHYASETLGVQRTASWLVEQSGENSDGAQALEWQFIDEPTGI